MHHFSTEFKPFLKIRGIRRHIVYIGHRRAFRQYIVGEIVYLLSEIILELFARQIGEIGLNTVEASPVEKNPVQIVLSKVFQQDAQVVLHFGVYRIKKFGVSLTVIQGIRNTGGEIFGGCPVLFRGIAKEDAFRSQQITVAAGHGIESGMHF